jgi:tRNA-guanine family transglycosylase
VHNLHFYADLMRRIRQAIRDGEFSVFYEEFQSQWKGGEVQSGEYSVCNG